MVTLEQYKQALTDEFVNNNLYNCRFADLAKTSIDDVWDAYDLVFIDANGDKHLVACVCRDCVKSYEALEYDMSTLEYLTFTDYIERPTDEDCDTVHWGWRNYAHLAHKCRLSTIIRNVKRNIDNICNQLNEYTQNKLLAEIEKI